jgi:hypothetical protein
MNNDWIADATTNLTSKDKKLKEIVVNSQSCEEQGKSSLLQAKPILCLTRKLLCLVVTLGWICMPLALILQRLLGDWISAMLGLVVALRERATARRSRTGKLDALRAQTIIGGQDLAPHECLDQLVAMEVMLMVRHIDHCLGAFELAAPEKGSVFRVEPSVVTFRFISREGGVVASSPRSGPVLVNRRQTRPT